jgi:hypothetical protein
MLVRVNSGARLDAIDGPTVITRRLHPSGYLMPNAPRTNSQILEWLAALYVVVRHACSRNVRDARRAGGLLWRAPARHPLRSHRHRCETHGFGLDRFIAEPLRLEAGAAVAPERPGHGIEFDWKGLDAVRAR